MRTTTLILLALLTAISPITFGAVAVFVHLDGVDGESKDDKHSQWIEVLSMNWNIQRDIAEQHHGARSPQAGKNLNKMSLVMTKRQDASSPALRRACVTGKPIKEAEIHFHRQTDQSRSDFTLFGFSLRCETYGIAAQGDLAPIESVTFSFEEIAYEFTEQKPDGSQSESGFSHKLGKKH